MCQMACCAGFSEHCTFVVRVRAACTLLLQSYCVCILSLLIHDLCINFCANMYSMVLGTRLTTVILPYSINHIGQFVFTRCTRLKLITLTMTRIYISTARPHRLRLRERHITLVRPRRRLRDGDISVRLNPPSHVLREYTDDLIDPGAADELGLLGGWGV